MRRQGLLWYSLWLMRLWPGAVWYQCTLLILCLMSHSSRMSKSGTDSGHSLLKAYGAVFAALRITELPLQGC